MENAKGDFYIFIDSDCMVPPHWLQVIDKTIREEQLDAFGGPDTYHPSFPPILKAINYSMTSFIGTGGTRGSRIRIGKFYPRSFNMGIRQEIFKKIGGMNDLRHGQDMDLSARIYEAGYKVGLIRGAYVYHKRRTSLPKFFRQIFNWGVARVNLSRSHKGLISLIHLLPSTLIAVLFILLILTLFLRWNTTPWKILIMLYLLVCLIAFLESLIKYKNLPSALLSIVTLTIQITAYGLGMIWAGIQLILGRDPRGFVRGYYGK